ncbi:1,4-dihydroxy-2-naphthoate polyprenyltransferase [Allostreptomyces psammosilenae]|uniref:1,4-dihydroxy-2-naphthoate octaprenyltransferase n=1 Tax=Allostreptomyces psammosilenae TaxID=1892865 RepID=A0A852ZV65_9ACTN|nr:1,4-dihydroxy-2-naphthoate polyprenyltransferase [Allostreptomyces psammosilenae]NYI05815.1 1,4-dihydroxy-2-naphthoate octaprenyltransferase [Allostreptomyces psammosilenae]
MATVAQWVEGARPRTLPTALSPVLAGSGAAALLGGFSLPRALLALVVALALQVGVNYANDYSDGIRGTDDVRVGPLRLVGSRVAAPHAVRNAAFAAFGVAGVAGLVLVALSGHWWLLATGVACVLAAWFYTGGRHPYGYHGLGEVFVFVFFGPVAVLGTTYTQADAISWEAVAASVAVGGYACAVLVANNLRDIPTDVQSGKRTLAVRMGDAGSRRLWTALVGCALVLGVLISVRHPWAALMVIGVPLAVRAIRPVLGGATGRALIPVLRDTGLSELTFAVGLTAGMFLTAA